MSVHDGGGPAFPIPGKVLHYPGGSEPAHTGISMRDYFAAKAMQAAIGMLAGNSFWNEGGFFSDLAKNAYEMADAMLEVREAQS